MGTISRTFLRTTPSTGELTTITRPGYPGPRERDALGALELGRGNAHGKGCRRCRFLRDAEVDLARVEQRRHLGTDPRNDVTVPNGIARLQLDSKNAARHRR